MITSNYLLIVCYSRIRLSKVLFSKLLVNDCLDHSDTFEKIWIFTLFFRNFTFESVGVGRQDFPHSYIIYILDNRRVKTRKSWERRQWKSIFSNEDHKRKWDFRVQSKTTIGYYSIELSYIQCRCKKRNTHFLSLDWAQSITSLTVLLC